MGRFILTRSVLQNHTLEQGNSTRDPPNVFVLPQNKFWILSVKNLIEINKCQIKFILEYFKLCTKILNIILFFMYEIPVKVPINTARL
jgi:hypothetical protein